MVTKLKNPVFVTDEVNTALIALKDAGHYRSIDEAIRPLLKLPHGHENPFKKGVEDNESIIVMSSKYPGIVEQSARNTEPGQPLYMYSKRTAKG